MKNIIHRVFTLTLCFLLLFTFSSQILAEEPFYANEETADGTTLDYIAPIFNTGVTPQAEDGNLVIVLDPGHGGGDPGANPVKGLYESDLNLKVSLYCKTYLEQFSNVTVYVTHENFYKKDAAKLGLADRAAIAKKYNADILISMHFNSATVTTLNGSEVYISCLEEYSLEALATAILNGLGDLGLTEIGVKTRVSESGDLWYDQTRLADYYGIIRGSCKQEIPSIIVEHCFINNPDEYATFADSDEKLQRMGESDAKAIVKTFGLDQDTSDSDLADIKKAALKELKAVYNAKDPAYYDAYYRAKIEEIYTDAVHRIEIANHKSKVDITLNRAITTLQYYPELPFTDVSVDDWFYNAVTFNTEKEIFYGTSEDTFSPHRAITRGEFIAVIGRLAEAEIYYPAQTKFTDVDPESYYAPYINWAAQNKIILGTTKTTFSPKSDIRREDLIRIMHNYCIAKKIELPLINQKTIYDFSDGIKTDTWAINDMNWAISCGLINGYEDNTLRPTKNISRAETAEIMMNFIKMIPGK